MKNLGVVITDGVGFRNFILTDFIKEAKTNFDEVIIFPVYQRQFITVLI